MLACAGLPVRALARITLEPDPEARESSFLWWRLVDGKVVDSGSCHPGPARPQQNDMLGSDGTLIRMFATQFAPPGSAPAASPPLPDYAAGKRYYSAVNPDAGMVAAQEHTPGETWVFKIGKRLLVSRYGFTAGASQELKVRCQHARGKAHEWTLNPDRGVWTKLHDEGYSAFAVGLAVAGCSELPQDWLEATGRRLKLPGNLGYLVVKEPQSGDRWSCTIGGKTLAVSTERVSFGEIARHEVDGFEVAHHGGTLQAPPLRTKPPPELEPEPPLDLPDGTGFLPLPLPDDDENKE